MAVKLRLMRMGRRNRAFFRINAVDGRTPRDGTILEKLGHYDPVEKDSAKQVVLNQERVKYWLDKGAIPSDTVSQILLRNGIKHKYAVQQTARRAKARASARAKGKLFTKAERIAAERAAKGIADKEQEAKVKAEAEAKAKAAADEKVRVEAQAKAEADEKIRVEAQAKAEAEEKLRAEAAEKEKKAKAEAAEEKAEAEETSKEQPEAKEESPPEEKQQ
jgi:small subunit ribosomal protein S16